MPGAMRYHRPRFQQLSLPGWNAGCVLEDVAMIAHNSTSYPTLAAIQYFGLPLEMHGPAYEYSGAIQSLMTEDFGRHLEEKYRETFMRVGTQLGIGPQRLIQALWLIAKNQRAACGKSS